MKKYVLSPALALACVSLVSAHAFAQGQNPGQNPTTPGAQAPSTPGAQTPSTPGGQTPTAQPAPRDQKPSTTTSATQSGTTTMVGCLYRERDVPGRTPNVAEKAGVLEDYILVNAMPAGNAGQSGAGAAGASVGTSGAAGKAGAMYKVESIPDEQLRAHVGKRVEVTGRVDAEAGDAKGAAGAAAGQRADQSVGPDRINLPEFEATSIKEVAGGTCPATPAAK